MLSKFFPTESKFSNSFAAHAQQNSLIWLCFGELQVGKTFLYFLSLGLNRYSIYSDCSTGIKTRHQEYGHIISTLYNVKPLVMNIYTHFLTLNIRDCTHLLFWGLKCFFMLPICYFLQHLVGPCTPLLNILRKQSICKKFIVFTHGFVKTLFIVYCV